MSVATESGPALQVLDYGDHALLLQFDTTAEVLAWAEAVRGADLAGVVDVVPASRTVLVKLGSRRDQPATRRRLEKLQVDDVGDLSPPGEADIVIDVVYDGPDLEDVAELTGLDTDGVVAAHTGNLWQVAFGGFAPGFAYLAGGDPRLQVARRDEPRTKVPTGSVALAGEFSGVYPRQSPGGWQLIGHTDAVLWDIDRSTPALLTPGMWVQFQVTS